MMSTTSVTAPIIAIGIGLLIFAAVWLVISILLSSLAGWPSLAEAFPGGPVPPGDRLRGVVLGLGAVRENNVTTLVPCPQGLYLYAMILFRLHRPPVLVPWARIRCLERKHFLWNRWYVLDLAGITTLKVRDRLGPILESHGVALPAEAD